MLKKTFMAVCLVAAVAITAAPVFSQQDMKNVPLDGFAKTSRPPAVFDHEAHNAKAKIDDCGICHHGQKDGKMDPAATTEGQPCADCHPAAGAKDKTPLMRAFHRQCGACHEKAGKGPVACGECHRRDAGVPAKPAKPAG
jgi:hypothetical protein